jgi:uncharacterized protein (TIGR02271 family)
MNERANLDQLKPGMAAFDALGAPLGTVEAIGTTSFQLAGQEVPASAIDRIDGEAVYLHLARAGGDRESGVVAATASDRFAAQDQIIYRDEERIVVPLAEERLRVETREVAQGEILIRKRVIEEERLVPVIFRREEVEIVRRGPGEAWPLDLPADDPTITRIPIHGWEPVVGTEAFVTREVVVEKTRVAEEGHATGTVRRERATVDERYAQVRPQLEQEFSVAQRAVPGGEATRTFAEAEPHYRAGFEVGSDPQYAGRDFSEVESAVQQDYESAGRHGDDGWTRLRQEIRAGFEAARRR